MNTEREHTVVKPYSMKELSVLYGVSAKTLRTWLRPHKDAIGARVSRYYTTLQVRVIFERLGMPGEGE